MFRTRTRLHRIGMNQSMISSDTHLAGPAPSPVVIKKYPNRRLYNTGSSSYITLENLAAMVRTGQDFVVQDARTSEDITRAVLAQIIMEEESKGERALLPVPFLRQLIAFYGDGLQGALPRYLEQAMEVFARQQQQMHQAMQLDTGSLLAPVVQEMGRQNAVMMKRAMSLFKVFTTKPRTSRVPTKFSAKPFTAAVAVLPVEHQAEKIAFLEAELAQMRLQMRQLEQNHHLVEKPPGKTKPTTRRKRSGKAINL